MELLNGKAKELFEKWLENQDVAPYKVMFYDIPIIVQQPYIIQWLDSINIAITIRPKNIKSWDYEVHYYQNMVYIFDCEFESRQEATTEAIKKAVELINESNGK